MTTTYRADDHYDRVTKAWELLLGEELHYGLFSRGDESLPVATRALTQRMVDASDLQPGLTVLDVGCGTGGPACTLAEFSAVRVTGITTSEAGLAAARKRALDLGVADEVVFELRDGTNNGLPDDTYERVWVLESSHLMPDRQALMSECARVLIPGGRLALCDIVLRRDLPFAEVRRLTPELGLLREVFGAAQMKALGTYVELCERAGLVDVVVDDLTDATRPTFDRWQANAIAYRAEVTDLLGSNAWQAFFDACDLLRAFWDDGTLGYGLLRALKA